MGQDWDKVWSEICCHADARALMGLHLRFRAGRYVAQVFEGPDGKLYETRDRELTRARWRWEFYLDPKTNQLRSLETQMSHTRHVDPPKVFAVDVLLLHQYEDGHWYWVEMAVMVRPVPSVVDCFLKTLSPRDAWQVRERLRAKYGRSPTGAVWCCIHKEAANQKDIRRCASSTMSSLPWPNRKSSAIAVKPKVTRPVSIFSLCLCSEHLSFVGLAALLKTAVTVDVRSVGKFIAALGVGQPRAFFRPMPSHRQAAHQEK